MRTLADIRAGFAALPEIGIDPWLAGRRPLILAPHPDDESLGCGGMIAAACASGLHPVVIILTDGAASHPGSREFPPDRLRRLRETEVAHATALLGLPLRNLHYFRQSDTQLPGEGPLFDSMAAKIVAIGRRSGCGMIIGPWAADPHCDHESAARLAAFVAVQTGWMLYSYPVWGWLRDGAETFDETRINGYRLDITAHQKIKQQAIAAHVSQYGDLIKDSPEGFRLPAGLLKVFARRFEVFIG